MADALGKESDPELLKQQRETASKLIEYATAKDADTLGEKRLIWSKKEGGLVLRKLRGWEKLGWFGRDKEAKLTQITAKLKEIHMEHHAGLEKAQEAYIKKHFKEPSPESKSGTISTLLHNISVLALFPELKFSNEQLAKLIQNLTLEQQLKLLEKEVKAGNLKEVEFLMKCLVLSPPQQFETEDKENARNLFASIFTLGANKGWDIGNMLQRFLKEWHTDQAKDTLKAALKECFTAALKPVKKANPALVKQNLRLLEKFTLEQIQLSEIDLADTGFNELSYAQQLKLLGEVLKDEKRKPLAKLLLEKFSILTINNCSSLLSSNEPLAIKNALLATMKFHYGDDFLKNLKLVLKEVPEYKREATDQFIIGEIKNLPIEQTAALRELLPFLTKEALENYTTPSLEFAFYLALAHPDPIAHFLNLIITKELAINVPPDTLRDLVNKLKKAYPQERAHQIDIIANIAIPIQNILHAPMAPEARKKAVADLRVAVGDKAHLVDECLLKTLTAVLSSEISYDDMTAKAKPFMDIWGGDEYLKNLSLALSLVPPKNRHHVAYRNVAWIVTLRMKDLSSLHSLDENQIALLQALLSTSKTFINSKYLYELNPTSFECAYSLAMALPECRENFLKDAKRLALRLKSTAYEAAIARLKKANPSDVDGLENFQIEVTIENLFSEPREPVKYIQEIEQLKKKFPQKQHMVDSAIQRFSVSQLSTDSEPQNLLTGLEHLWGDDFWKKLGAVLQQIPKSKQKVAYVITNAMLISKIGSLLAATSNPDKGQASKAFTQLKEIFPFALDSQVDTTTTLHPSDLRQAVLLANLFAKKKPSRAESILKEDAIPFALSMSDKALNDTLKDLQDLFPKAEHEITAFRMKILIVQLKENPDATLKKMKDTWTNEADYLKNIGLLLEQAKKQGEKLNQIPALAELQDEFVKKLMPLIRVPNLALLKTLLPLYQTIVEQSPEALTIEGAFCLAICLPDEFSIHTKKARELAKTMTKSAYLKEIEKLKVALQTQRGALSDLQDFDLSCRFEVSDVHLKKGVIPIDIPEKPAGSDLSELYKLFGELEFHDESAPNYIDLDELLSPDHAGTNNPVKLLGQLNAFIQRVMTNENEWAGIPDGWEERNKFYRRIENALIHTIIEIRRIEEQDKLDGTTHGAKLKAKFMMEMLGAAPHCAPREFTTAVEQYRQIVCKIPPTLENGVYYILGETRCTVFETLVPSGPESVLYFDRLMRRLGRELGLPTAAILTTQKERFPHMDPKVHEKDVPRIKATFFSRYSPSAILGNVDMDFQMNNDLRNKAKAWLCEHEMPKWSKAKDYDAFKIEIAEMRKGGAGPQAIMEKLKLGDPAIVALAQKRQATPQAILAGLEKYSDLKDEIARRKEKNLQQIRELLNEERERLQDKADPEFINLVKNAHLKTPEQIIAALEKHPKLKEEIVEKNKKYLEELKSFLAKDENPAILDLAQAAFGKTEDEIVDELPDFTTITVTFENKEINAKITDGILACGDKKLKEMTSAVAERRNDGKTADEIVAFLKEQKIPIRFGDLTLGVAIERAIDRCPKTETEKEKLKSDVADALGAGKSFSSVIAWLQEEPRAISLLEADIMKAVIENAIDASDLGSLADKNTKKEQVSKRIADGESFDSVIAWLKEEPIAISVPVPAIRDPTAAIKAADTANIDAAIRNAIEADYTTRAGLASTKLGTGTPYTEVIKELSADDILIVIDPEVISRALYEDIAKAEKAVERVKEERFIAEEAQKRVKLSSGKQEETIKTEMTLKMLQALEVLSPISFAGS